MLKKFAILLVLLSFGMQAQHTISGKMTKPAKADWIILYKIDGGDQSFIANTNVKDNHFSFTLKKEDTPGIYRLFYQMAKQTYLDFIYNNEDIVLSFDPNDPAGSINFIKSDENSLFKRYTENSAIPQSELDNIQLAYFKTTGNATDAKLTQDYILKLQELNKVQQQFENLSKSMLTHHFIVASKRTNADKPFKNAADYLAFTKAHFFDGIDFNNPILVKSTLIIDRVNDYIFYVNVSPDPKMQTQLYKTSIANVFDKIHNPILNKSLVYYLLKRFSTDENKAITEFLLTDYFDKLPLADQDLDYKNTLIEKMKIAINATAPDIAWQDFGGNKSLYQLKGAKYYLILFWSSTCSHCLHEVPLLYDYLKDKKEVKVLAIGLEDTPNPWNDEMSKYPNFIHVFGENHWKNKYAKAYDIHATPTYIVLDSAKTIIAKPYDINDVKAFFSNLKM